MLKENLINAEFAKNNYNRLERLGKPVNKIFIALISMVILTSCADIEPKLVKPVLTSTKPFQTLTCNQLKNAMEDSAQQINLLYQRKKRLESDDLWQAGVAILSISLVAIFLEYGSSDVKQELAKERGKHHALSQVAVQKKCVFSIDSPIEVIRKANKKIELEMMESLNDSDV